jgi:hypothetical protein
MFLLYQKMHGRKSAAGKSNLMLLASGRRIWRIILKMASEIWFREFERQLNEREARPVVCLMGRSDCEPERCAKCVAASLGRAYQEATSETDVALRERYFDAADRARKIAKGE